MRLDKYLKVARLVKRRTVANQLCDSGNVMVNGKVAKASVEVKTDDLLKIRFGNRLIEVQVLQVPGGASVPKGTESTLFQLVSESYEETVI